MKFYAVHVGRKPGVYHSWKECETQITKYPGAKYKKFSTLNEAKHFARNGFDLKAEQELLTKLFSKEFEETPQSKDHVFVRQNKKTSLGKRKQLESTDDSSKRVKVDIKEPTTMSSLPNYTNNQIFPKHSDEKVECPIVYTDGACSNNGKAGCRAGYGVWWGENHTLNLSCKLKGKQTNQRAEIAAINAAIKQAKDNGYKDLLIKTDSMFVINCVTKWIPAWKKRGWTKADGNPVVHKVEFLEMLENMKDVKIKFEHVRGHQGIYGNEMADRLAVQGSKLL